MGTLDSTGAHHTRRASGLAEHNLGLDEAAATQLPDPSPREAEAAAAAVDGAAPRVHRIAKVELSLRVVARAAAKKGRARE